MKSFTRSSTAVHVDRIESGVRKVVSSTSRMLRPSTPIWKAMFQPATWIQGRLMTICNPGLPELNCANMAMEMPKVIVEATSATQRAAFFCSALRKTITTAPSSGKNVTRVRGCRK